MNRKITIAIDGFSSTGKSTIAKQVAKKLGYVYVDTGAMYRAVTLFSMRNNLVLNNEIISEELTKQLKKITISFKFNQNLGFAEVFLNDENIENEIRTLAVSQLVSKVAKISSVRKKLVAEQQEMGKEKGVVMDGRDIGTVVFPDAELKLFMTASAEKRATRRYNELIERGDKVAYNDVLKNIIERDEIDSTRKDSPLIKADDAIEIDNSEMTIEEQYDKILQLVHQKLN